LGNGSIGQDTHESDAARPYALPGDEPDGSGFSTRRIAAIVGAAVAAVLVGVVLMLVLTSEEATPPQPNDFGTMPQTPAGAPAPLGGTSTAARVDRGATDVAVLNGTTETGLARAVADKIEGAGFKITSVGNNVDQQVPTTIVHYAPGRERVAQTVAQTIGIAPTAVRAADANTSVAAEADVVVTVGTDQTE
jgi:hypothetical protein